MATKTGQLAITLLKHFESLHDGDQKKIGLQPKPDPIGIYTEGYGRAMINPFTKKFLTVKDTTQAQAEALQTIHTEAEAVAALAMDIKPREYAVAKMLGDKYMQKLTEDQVGCFVSFVYNGGTHYNNGKTPFAIWKNAQLWLDGKMSDKDFQAYWDSSVIKAGGKVLSGLVRRRRCEAYLCIYGKNAPNFFQ